jgi:predicted RNase H-like nuclease
MVFYNRAIGRGIIKVRAGKTAPNTVNQKKGESNLRRFVCPLTGLFVRYEPRTQYVVTNNESVGYSIHATKRAATHAANVKMLTTGRRDLKVETVVL